MPYRKCYADEATAEDGRVEAARLRLERSGRCPECGRPAGECDEDHGQEEEGNELGR